MMIDVELLKVLAPYFTSIVGAAVAVGIALYNNIGRAKTIERVDQELQELKKNHFYHLGGYLKKLNGFLARGKLMDEAEKAGMDVLADGVAGRQ